MVGLKTNILMGHAKGQIVYFIEGRSPSRQDINGGFEFLAGALMEHVLVGSAPLKLW